MAATWLVPIIALQHVITATEAPKFGCKNAMISDEWREEMVTLHNKHRSTLAKGEQMGATKLLPVAQNMNYLRWDCNLEEMANSAAQGCPDGQMTPSVSGHGALGFMSASTTIEAACNATKTAGTLIKKLWKEGAKLQINERRVPNNDAFSQMAFHWSSSFGCAYQTCGRKYYQLCFYQRNALGYGVIYVAGHSSNEMCKHCLPRCKDALCHQTFTPVVDKVSKVCKGCSGDLTDDFRLTAMNMHNYYRQAVNNANIYDLNKCIDFFARRLLATGWVVDKQIQHAKPAKAMNKLVYVKTLEDAALNHVRNCDNIAPEKNPPVGESFWRGKSGSYQLSHVEAMEQAMKDWWGPFESTGLGSMLDYTTGTQNGPLKYFANIVHDKTKEIGCAAKTCQKQGVTLVDCRYNTAVALDDAIYEVGKMPCKCPAGTACSKLGGLCEATP